jgi:hypothetical protein
MFADEASLERVLERAVGDPEWRRARAGALAERVRASMTHDAFARGVLGFVRDRL